MINKLLSVLGYKNTLYFTAEITTKQKKLMLISRNNNWKRDEHAGFAHRMCISVDLTFTPSTFYVSIYKRNLNRAKWIVAGQISRCS